MSRKIRLIANPVLPIAPLPHCLLPLAGARGIRRRFEIRRAMAGKMAFDQVPARREIAITRRQGPEAVQMLRQQDQRIELEGVRASDRLHGALQQVHALRQAQNRPAVLRHHGKETRRAGRVGAPMTHGRAVAFSLESCCDLVGWAARRKAQRPVLLGFATLSPTYVCWSIA